MGEGRRDRDHLGLLRRGVSSPARACSAGRPPGSAAAASSSCCGRAWSSPTPRSATSGAIYLWVEEVDEQQRPERPAALLPAAVLASSSPTARSRRATRSWPAIRRRGEANEMNGEDSSSAEDQRQYWNSSRRRHHIVERSRSISTSPHRPDPRVEFRPMSNPTAAAEALIDIKP